MPNSKNQWDIKPISPKLCGVNNRDWDDQLGLIDFCYNCTKHLAIRT
jgi:hypothetical protein